jgi:hypothetical protein
LRKGAHQGSVEALTDKRSTNISSKLAYYPTDENIFLKISKARLRGSRKEL